MKTITTITAMPADNIFRITDIGSYHLVTVTAQEGEDKVEMSFPWAHSIPYMNADVQDAIAICAARVRDTMSQQIERRKNAQTLAQKLLAFIVGEVRYLFSMCKIST